ncbi:Hypothetical predicted protein [Paramuricea clavata]|uniref:Uncharacterized protein n=1 Tax=Paramuricea clavata TaxID=317549 RepID=A0A6S7HC22_PARCT|nr:Hypothetical predicted protein [Paramuricea clavata]
MTGAVFVDLRKASDTVDHTTLLGRSQVVGLNDVLSDSEPVIVGRKQNYPEDLVIADRLQHFSNWHKAKKAVAVCLRFKEKLIAKVHEKTACEGDHIRNHSKENEASHSPYTPSKGVEVEDLLNAEKEIVKNVEEQAFKSELTILQSMKEDAFIPNKRSKKLKKASTLSRLDPFIDCDGIMRVGG